MGRRKACTEKHHLRVKDLKASGMSRNILHASNPCVSDLTGADPPGDVVYAGDNSVISMYRCNNKEDISNGCIRRCGRCPLKNALTIKKLTEQGKASQFVVCVHKSSLGHVCLSVLPSLGSSGSAVQQLTWDDLLWCCLQMSRAMWGSYMTQKHPAL
jgi:hypothetical protein